MQGQMVPSRKSAGGGAGVDGAAHMLQNVTVSSRPLAPHVYITAVLDASGSMSGLKNTVIDTIGDVIAEFKKKGIETRWMFYYFRDNEVVKMKKQQLPGHLLKIDKVKDWYNAAPSGMTNFFDAVHEDLQHFKRMQGQVAGYDWHKVLMVLTDGGDNTSTLYPRGDSAKQKELQTMMAKPGMPNFNVFMLTMVIQGSCEQLVDDLTGFKHGHHINVGEGTDRKKSMQELLSRFKAKLYEHVLKVVVHSTSSDPQAVMRDAMRQYALPAAGGQKCIDR